MVAESTYYFTRLLIGILSHSSAEQKKFTSDRGVLNEFFVRKREDFPELLGGVPVYQTVVGKRMHDLNTALTLLHAQGVIWYCGRFAYEFGLGKESCQRALEYFPNYAQKPLQSLSEKFQYELMR